MNKFKKWRKQRKPAQAILVPTDTPRDDLPPRYETDPHQEIDSLPVKFGLDTVHDSPDAIVDICFIHGLTGDRDKTWTAHGQSAPWPKILLPKKLNARILMYGYDAHVTRKSVASTNRLINHSQNLLGDLTADRGLCNASSRPIIFVAHSLGGLVCKKTILLSQNAAESHSRELFNSVKGVVFMGTPHKGAWMADWAKIPASIFGLVKSTNVMLLDILQKDNQLLESIQVDFLTMIRRLREGGRSIEITCFFEELPFPVVGKIVTTESATLDGYEIYSIYANHRDMARFASDEDPGFKRLLWQLHSWTAQVDQANKIGSYELEKEDKACLRDLRTTNPYDDKARIEEHKGGLFRESYRWILSDKRFLEWQVSEKGAQLLWIRGDPGKGKTMLVCGIIDEISTMNNGILSFFFCEATDAELNTATAVLRGLIYTMIEQEPSLISHVRQRYDTTGKQLFEGSNAWQALSDIFIDILGDLPSASLVIDALDECTNGLNQLLDLITHISLSHPHVKWIVSSRSWPNIKERLDLIPDNAKIELELSEKSVSEAVRVFIHNKVQQLAKLKKYTQQIIDAVQTHLLSHAQGTFLWVALVCEKLAQIPRLKTIEKLTAFPAGLDALYRRMLQQVCDQEEAPLYKSVLGLVSTVKRPINLDELAMFIDVSEELGDYESLEEIVGYCGSFLNISKNTIFFVHQSAKEFLLEKATSEILPLGVANQHQKILLHSLKNMSVTLRRDIWDLNDPGCSIDQARSRRPYPDPLKRISYSCVYWIAHLTDCEESDLRTELQNGGRVDSFLSEVYLHWLEALGLLGHVSEGLTAMSQLQSLVQTRDSDLVSRVQDAIRFLQYFKLVIEKSPLQLYSSALTFCPSQSAIRASFQHDNSSDIALQPSIDHWNPCLQTLEGHRYSVNILGVSPNGKYTLSASEEGCIKLWNSTNGELVLSLDGHCDEITSFIWSKDSACLVSASYDAMIKIWDLTIGKCASTLEGHAEGINNILWLNNEKELVSCSNDKTIKIWDRAKGACMKTLEGHIDAVISMIWLNVRKQLVSGSKDGIIKIWDLDAGQSPLTLTGHSSPITSFISCCNENRLISASEDHVVKVWDSNTWQCILTLKGHSSLSGLKCMTLSQDNKLVTLDHPTSKVAIWDLSIGQRVVDFSISPYSMPYFALFKDGRIATASRLHGTIQIWDTSSGQCISTLKGHRDKMAYLLPSHDGTKLISASWDKSVKIWDIDASTENETAEEKAESVIASPEGMLFLSVYDSRVKVWDPAAGQCVSTFHSENDIIGRVSWWSEDSIAIALTGDEEKFIKIWNHRTNDCSLTFHAFDVQERTDWRVTSMNRSHHGSQYAAISDLRGTVRFWDSATSQSLKCLRISDIGANTTISYDGAYFASVSDDQTIKVWDASTGQLGLTMEGHRSPDEGTLVNKWRYNSKGLFQDPYTGQWIPIMESWLVLRKAVVETVLCWSNDSKWLVSASLKTIKVWDIATSRCALLLDIGRHAGKIRFSENDPYTLHTSIGTFDLRPYLTKPIPETGHLISSPQPKGYGFSEDRVWITLNGVNFLWLPPEYRPESTQQTDLYGETVVIGSVTGRVLFLKFPKEGSA